jgi:hypothetical protein
MINGQWNESLHDFPELRSAHRQAREKWQFLSTKEMLNLPPHDRPLVLNFEQRYRRLISPDSLGLGDISVNPDALSRMRNWCKRLEELSEDHDRAQHINAEMIFDVADITKYDEFSQRQQWQEWLMSDDKDAYFKDSSRAYMRHSVTKPRRRRRAPRLVAPVLADPPVPIGMSRNYKPKEQFPWKYPRELRGRAKRATVSQERMARLFANNKALPISRSAITTEASAWDKMTAGLFEGFALEEELGAAMEDTARWLRKHFDPLRSGGLEEPEPSRMQTREERDAMDAERQLLGELADSQERARVARYLAAGRRQHKKAWRHLSP